MVESMENPPESLSAAAGEKGEGIDSPALGVPSVGSVSLADGNRHGVGPYSLVDENLRLEAPSAGKVHPHVGAVLEPHPEGDVRMHLEPRTQTDVVIASGSSWSQGLFAPLPSKNL